MDKQNKPTIPKGAANPDTIEQAIRRMDDAALMAVSKAVEERTKQRGTIFIPPTGKYRNTPCQCGSGKKFKNCCYDKKRTEK